MIKFKKLLSVLLAVMMVMSVMPTGLAFADDEVSLQASAGIPAGAISLYEEDFEDYTVGESLLTKAEDEWDFYSMANTNVADAAKIVDVSEISVDNKTGFSGKALMIHNEEATAYNTKGLMYRFGLENAIDLNSVENAEYFAGAAEEILPKLVKSDLKPDAIILDPPRKGCDESLLRLLLEMETEKIVYISCSPATLARDLKILSEKYNISPITPVDMFPNTYHVETVALLSRLRPDDVIEVELKSEDLHLTSAEAKATYQQIKDYIFRKYGFKVSSLYIAQVKQKMGLPMGKNYNTSKKGTKVPVCPPEKEKAIKDALEHFKMV